MITEHYTRITDATTTIRELLANAPDHIEINWLRSMRKAANVIYWTMAAMDDGDQSPQFHSCYMDIRAIHRFATHCGTKQQIESITTSVDCIERQLLGIHHDTADIVSVGQPVGNI